MSDHVPNIINALYAASAMAELLAEENPDKAKPAKVRIKNMGSEYGVRIWGQA